MSNNHLIVGLGGTGGKIIRHLRKTIERSKDAQGNSASEARFEYLYVDTSDDEVSKKEEWKVLGKEIDLDRSQYLINTASNVRPVLNDPESFPGLRDWIEPREVFDFVNATTAGAAQRRKLGRVVFAQNAPRFVKAIEDRLQVLESAPGSKKGAVIHIVCGLAGGTGSGSVVDAVAQIRHKCADHELYRVLVYAVLPEKHSRRVKDVAGLSTYYANGYAALAELNALAVGKYKPVNLLDGSRLEHDIYFNGCYLVNNINEHNVQFDVDAEVPRLVAEFIFQKTMNKEWEGLGRAEKGENDIKNFESDANIGKARAKLFMSFGIKRVVVPEQEIKEYLAYGFAEQATRQLMYNNFRQGEGYADEAVEKDWGSESRKADVLQSLLLTDAHLTLETGILEDDARNSTWKSPREYWKQIISLQVPEIRADKNIDEANWLAVLNARLSKVFDETYRTMGGVRKFFEIKGNARLEMARHIARHIEKDLFARWKAGNASLFQLRQFMDALIAMLDERLALLSERVAKLPSELDALHARIKELEAKFNNVGIFAKALTDKRGALFADIGALLQDQYTLQTNHQGLKFACGLVPFIKDQLISLRGTIDGLHQNLVIATDKVGKERAGRLKAADAVYQKRIFDETAIANVMKALIVDEASQMARTQRVRQSIIDLAGTDVDSFDVLLQGTSLGSIIATLSQESAQIVELAHAEIAKQMPPVLHVNIVERLQKRYDANESGLREFVSQLYEEAGTTLVYNKTEVDRTVANNVGGSQGRAQTIGVFLPESESQKEFRGKLAGLFESQKDPASDTKVSVGKLSNQIVLMKISSLMPARFVESLGEFKRHYDGLLADDREAVLLHGEGNGTKLPPLFARSAAEIRAESRRKPYVLLARLLGMVKERQNRTTGLMEWVFTYIAGDLPKVHVLQGKTWFDVLEADQPAEAQLAIEKEVAKRLDAEYKHIDKKEELRTAYRQMVRARFEEVEQDEQDPQIVVLGAMRDPMFEIAGLPLND